MMDRLQDKVYIYDKEESTEEKNYTTKPLYTISEGDGRDSSGSVERFTLKRKDVNGANGQKELKRVDDDEATIVHFTASDEEDSSYDIIDAKEMLFSDTQTFKDLYDSERNHRRTDRYKQRQAEINLKSLQTEKEYYEYANNQSIKTLKPYSHLPNNKIHYINEAEKKLDSVLAQKLP